MNTALEYSTRVVQEGDRRCIKSTLNDLAYLTPLRIPLMNPVYGKFAQNFGQISRKRKNFTQINCTRLSSMGPPDRHIKGHSPVLRPGPALRSPPSIQSHSPLCITTKTTVYYWSEERKLTHTGLQSREIHVIGTESLAQIRPSCSILDQWIHGNHGQKLQVKPMSSWAYCAGFPLKITTTGRLPWRANSSLFLEGRSFPLNLKVSL